ncbi:MAG: LD-carboxypeptidase, partial [Oligoflexia bacterium]|nr:LD-carboxypeptidase [Oligoflexia bacterium]
MRSKKIFAKPHGRWVGIAASSTLVDKKLLLDGLELFSEWDCISTYSEMIFQRFRSMAGSDLSRTKNIEHLLKNKNVGTLWFARGGYGATRLLPIFEEKKLASLLKKDPKLLIGFSDVTAIHLYFYKKLKLPSLHAPMPATKSWGGMPLKTKELLRTFMEG